MEKKYQVFVSSTYKDLTEERQQVIQALLELDCIPVGMELFPAADDDQWTLIKRLIDDCDYYIVIVAGRYGSTNIEGISYTQMEYEYALTKGIPIIGFVHSDPGAIPSSKTELDATLRAKLDAFKTLVQKKMVKQWNSPSELGSLVSRSLVKLIKDKPQIGWVKANNLPSEDSMKEILDLRKQVDVLQGELIKFKTSAPEGTEKLSSGNDTIWLDYRFEVKANSSRISGDWYTANVQVTWDRLFFEIGPLMIDEADDEKLKNTIGSLIRKEGYVHIKPSIEKLGGVLGGVRVNDSDFQTVKIQFRALGYITESVKKRSIHDKGPYWTLTPYGDTIMTRLRAITKEDEETK